MLCATDLWRRTFNLFPLSLAFDNRDVPVNWQIRETFLGPARLRPRHFQPVNLDSLADAQHQTRIMRREVASPSHLDPSSLQISRLVNDSRANSIWIRLLSHQHHPQPVVERANLVAQE